MPRPPSARPTIRRLAAAFPPHRISQADLYHGLLERWYAAIPGAAELVFQSRVRHRNFGWDPRLELRDRSPSLAERMVRFRACVESVAGESVGQLLAGADRAGIGSFVMASCTGYSGPTTDCLLARALGLRLDLRRTFIGHMGCFAAFNALKVAMDSVVARPHEPVLVNCTELCSFHMRPEPSREQLVIHSLFGDASVSALVEMAAPGEGVGLVAARTEHLYATGKMMTWDLGDQGFVMTLSPYVPLLLTEQIEGFVTRLLASVGLDVGAVRHWIIHPGGPRIVENIAGRLGLSPADTAPSMTVLEQHGNCSSGTVLLVLQEVLRSRAPGPGEYGVMMAFGPGLTMEGMVVQF